MARINDLGGTESFGAIDTSESGEQSFHADWEARVHALAVTLLSQGHWTLDEFRDAIERLPPARYLHATYYERWLGAVETLVVERGLLDGAALGEANRE